MAATINTGTPFPATGGGITTQPYGSPMTLGGMVQQPQQGGGLPPWVTPDQAQFYNTLNQGWMQGHGGQPIPQERFQYLQGAYNDEAAQGANGSHVGDMGWWQNRASIDRGPDPGEPGYVPGQGGQTLGQMAGVGFSPNAQNGVASFNAPGLLAPYTKEFQGTDINTILNAPAFQADQANGIDELGRSAAAHGTLLTGGFGKDLMKYSMGLGLGELNNQFNRDLSTFGTNRDTFYGNQNNAFNKLSSFANTGANIANGLNQDSSGYAQNAQVNANNQGNLISGQGDASAAAGLANAQNTNQTLGGIAQSVFTGGNGTDGFSWSNVFKRPGGNGMTPPYAPPNNGVGINPIGGAASNPADRPGAAFRVTR